MEIFKLFGSIYVEDKDAVKSIDDIDNKAKKTGQTLGDMIGTAAKWGAGLAAGATVAIGGLFGLAAKASEAASEIKDMSVRTGLSTTRLQELKFASEQSGVAFESVQAAVAKMTMSMGKADEEGKGMSLAFEKLGINTRDASGAMLDTETVFNQALVKLAEMDNATERNVLGMQIFGRGFTELSPLVSGGAASLEEMSAKAHRLGLIMSEEAVNAGDEFGDALDAVKASLEQLVKGIGIELMPTFQNMMDWVLAHMPEIQSGIETAINAGESAFNLLGDAVKFVKENLDIILPVIGGVTAAILAQSIIGTVTNLMKAWSTATKTQTALQWLLNVAMDANPLGLVALAIGAVVAAGVLLYQNWDTVKKKAGELWTSVEEIFGKIGKFVNGVFDGIVTGIKTAINSVSSAINGLIRGLNKIHVDIPGMSFGINIPEIPMLAKGGEIVEDGRVLVGEKGPELLDLTRGAKVKPLGYADAEAAEGSGTVNHFRDINMTIPVKDLREMKDVTEFFERLQQTARALGPRYSS